jgi:hypothetical protein
MTNQDALIPLAKALPEEERGEILKSFKETDLHGHLKALLGNMEPDSLVEITHGSEEHGNDLVRVNSDKFRELVTGIIVKSGDIGGKTKGRVDEIKSQVGQSLAHPVKLKAIAERTLSISEVWIMIAGKVTKGAHARIEKEIKPLSGNITCFGLDWLVKSFTQYYPQVFYEGRIMDFLKEKITPLEESVPMFNLRGKNLSECFVGPTIRMTTIPKEEEDEEFLDVTIEEKKFPFSEFGTILSPKAKIILFGEPGVGKSVALNKFVLERFQETWTSAINKELPDKIEIPFLITANDFFKKIDDFKTLLDQYIHPHTEIFDRLRITVLIIDGLDEVPSGKRNEVLKKAEALSKQLNCPLLISTRKTDLVKNPPVGFETYELLSFNFKQAIELYQKLTIDIVILTALRRGLESIRYQIPMTPLSLFLLLKIVESRGEVPASITELYDQFSDIVLGRYDVERGIMVIFEYLIKKRFLAALAFEEFLEKERLEMPQKEFIDFVKKYAKLYKWDEVLLKKFVLEIERAGILNLTEKAVSFRHGSFLDYFGAHYIWDNREKFENLEDFIVKIYFDDSWEDVAFFYIGLQRKIDSSLLIKLFEFDEENLRTYVDKFLIGKLLQAGWHSTADTLYEGIQKAIIYAPVIREESAKILKKNEKTFPKICLDILVMLLSDHSLGSRILFRGEGDVFNNLAKSPSYKNAYMMISLLCAFERFLEKEDLQTSITKILGVLDDLPKENIEEKAGILTLLMIMSEKNKKLLSTLKRRLRNLFKAHPEMHKRVLGTPKREKFRKKKRR